MEPAKFKNVKLDSRFKKYALNKPRIDFEKIVPRKSNQTTEVGTNSFSDVHVRGISRRNVSSKRCSMLKDNSTDALNLSLSRATMKKMKRYNTDSSAKEENLDELKNYIKGLTKMCNQIDRRHTQDLEKENAIRVKEIKQAGRKFMMRHLSFSDIEEDKIQQQKLLMKKMKAQRRTGSKMIYAAKATITEDSASKTQQKALMQMLKSIDKIYGILESMCHLGYVTKLNKYMISFCTGLKFWLSEVFLEESRDKKDAFSTTTKYLVLGTAYQAKNSLTAYLLKEQNMDLNVKAHDIEELLQYIESVLSQKKIQQITHCAAYIESRINHHKINQSFAFDDLRLASYTSDHFNFSHSISQLEEKYGPMKQISKVSRNRFEDLNRTLEKLQALV